MSPIEIIRMIILILVCAYVFGAIILLYSLFRLRKSIRRLYRVLYLHIDQRRKALLFLAGVTDIVPEKIMTEEISEIDAFAKPNFARMLEIYQTNDNVSRKIFVALREQPERLKIKRVSAMVDSLKSDDIAFRKAVIEYNRTAGTYNYWLRSIFFHWIGRLFNFVLAETFPIK